LAFGWVPAQAVRSLQEDVGNFRARGAAIEVVHAAVLDVGTAVNAAAVRATLSAFLAFLLRLVADHNCRIAVSAMSVLDDLAARLLRDLEPYLGSIMGPLIERLGDSVQVHMSLVHELFDKPACCKGFSQKRRTHDRPRCGDLAMCRWCMPPQ
jgi:hypothetical protein